MAYLFTLFGGLKIRIFLAAILDLFILQELSKVEDDTRKGQRNKELQSTKHFEVKVKSLLAASYGLGNSDFWLCGGVSA